MFGFLKRNKVKVYKSERPDAAQRIMRAQVAGLNGNVTTLLTAVQVIGRQLDRIELAADAAREYATIAARAGTAVDAAPVPPPHPNTMAGQ